ncbi:hypothetical protein EAO30_16095 [Klebsiella pneumoniae]|nr:hypothetical protein EAO30_16095 [Klebsiella pneumoniae]
MPAGRYAAVPAREIHHYGRHPDASEWYHQWVYFRPRAYWHEWLNWPTIFAQTGFFPSG